jgi:hypothetical protein
MTASKKKAVAHTFSVTAENVADIDAKRLAQSTADPFTSALRVVSAAERSTFIGKAIDAGDAWSGCAESLVSFSNELRQNDLTSAEDMLMSQAVALQSLFARMAESALATTDLAPFDVKFRYALRAQAQCRATLETLAAIKNPPVVFARQANVSNGPQQINNGPVTRRSSRVRKNRNERSELSGDAIELPPDTRTPALACRTDTPLASMGEIDRTSDGGREGAGVAERMEGRLARLAADLGAGPAKAKAVVEPVKARRRGALR